MNTVTGKLTLLFLFFHSFSLGGVGRGGGGEFNLKGKQSRADHLQALSGLEVIFFSCLTQLSMKF